MIRVFATRAQILTIGPIVLVATCYAIAPPVRFDHDRNHSHEATCEPEDDWKSNQPLTTRCDDAAKMLKAQLSKPWTFVIHEPFVLGSDLSEQQIESIYVRTIEPTIRALAHSYFNQQPNHPIAVLLCSSDDRFQECNLRLDDQERSQYSGIYVRKNRRVIVNIASGEGTLAHELTHALAHADFPTMPEWFDEGLASLHEECEFSQDGSALLGNPNWRCFVAFEALQRGELRLLEDLATRRFGSRGGANLDYAHVRSFCLFLQNQRLLEPFYRACRLNTKTDPTGLRSLCETAKSQNPGHLDDQFRAWLIRTSHAEE